MSGIMLLIEKWTSYSHPTHYCGKGGGPAGEGRVSTVLKIMVGEGVDFLHSATPSPIKNVQTLVYQNCLNCPPGTHFFNNTKVDGDTTHPWIQFSMQMHTLFL